MPQSSSPTTRHSASDQPATPGGHAGLRYALYVRKSTEEDERQSQSLASQIEQVHDLAQRKGLNVVLTLEESRSAKEPGRPQFQHLLALIDAGEIDGIIAWHPDRLSRNEMDAAALTMRVRKGILHDLAFVSYFFHNSPEGVMMLQMALCQSQYMVSKLSKDVKRGIDDKLKKGWYPHRAPLGYRNDKHKDKGDKTISPDPERFPLIRQAWDMLLTGAYSVPRLQQIMNDDWGMRTPVTRSGRGGTPLAKSTLYRLFSNVFYAGQFIHDGTLYTGAHQPMVTLDEFDRAQRLIGRDNSLRPRGHRLPFTGLIRCAGCGGMVTAETRVKPSGLSYTYYHCAGRGSCTKRGVRQDRLEVMIDAELSRMDLLPEFYEWAIEEIEKASAKERAERQAVSEQKQRALKEADALLDSLLGMRLRDLITDEEYKAKRTQFALDRERLSQEVRSEEAGADPAGEACRSAADYMKNARAWLREGAPDMKRIVAFNLGSNYLLKDGSLLLEPHPMLVRVRNEYKALEAKYRRIELGGTGSGSSKKDALASVRAVWSGIWEANRTQARAQNLTFPTIAA